MNHTLAAEEMHELAASYALGALTQAEARAFEDHLAEGCEVCDAELREFESLTSALSYFAPEVEPPAEARDKLLSLVASETGKDSATTNDSTAVEVGAEEFETDLPLIDDAAPGIQPQVFTIRADEGDWTATEDEGVFVKPLFLDKERKLITTLVKLMPGASVRTHKHRGVEQCYILEGDFLAGGQHLGPGDFHIAMPGSVHEPVSSVNGALLLIVSPIGYEVLEGRA